ADFVTALASNPLVSNPVCVRLAGQVTKLGDATPDAEQGVQIEGIAESLRLCQVVRTAAIAPLQISPF
ncbi:MAG TPA: hypothetical protein VL133_09785, partial [Devosia sp.]|nr:hypothetical protein [Devosia sp.]